MSDGWHWDATVAGQAIRASEATGESQSGLRSAEGVAHWSCPHGLRGGLGSLVRLTEKPEGSRPNSRPSCIEGR